MRQISEHRYPRSTAVNAVVCVAIVLATGVVVEKWLRSPNRLAFRLSSLLKVIAIVACLIAWSSAQDEVAFRLVHQVDNGLDYSPMVYPTVPVFREISKAIALAGLGCVISVAFSLVCGFAGRLAADYQRAIHRS